MSEILAQSDIWTFQRLMEKEEQVDLTVRHHFSDGLYIRELFIPAGVCVVGATHKTRHMFMVLSGICREAHQFGHQEMEGPFMGETEPGTKRVIYAVTDCVWMTFHPTDITDLDELAKVLLEEDYK